MSEKDIPLAERMRPLTLDEVVGQHRILGDDSMLQRSIQRDRIPSMIFWGPPGCGKTTTAMVIKNNTERIFKTLSAVSAGVKDVKQVISEARAIKSFNRQTTVLFIDEIHRFNKSQQDALLQAVEAGVITLIGATTENPGFEVNAALLSRCQLVLFAPLDEEAQQSLIDSALYNHPRGLQLQNLKMDAEVRKRIISEADGDARFLLNQLEWIADSLSDAELAQETFIDADFLEKLQYHKPLRYDKKGEEHYNLISVFHKSIRGSDPNAALYWLHRMIQGGEDPRYILRRMIRMASEDIGMADSQALVLATSAREAYDFLGAPEGLLALDHLAVYLCMAPKSNRIELAHFAAADAARKFGNLPVPRAFRNAENSTGRQLGYGQGYRYDHNSPDAYSGQDHLPTKIQGTKLYDPTDFGDEKKVKDRLAHFEKLKQERN